MVFNIPLIGAVTLDEANFASSPEKENSIRICDHTEETSVPSSKQLPRPFLFTRTEYLPFVILTRRLITL